MSASLLLVGRETVEASLLIGILLAYLERTGNRRYFASIWLGTGLGVAASALLGTALFVTLGSLRGTAESIFEGTVMWAAAAVLTYVLWWMRRQGGSLKGSLHAGAKAALGSGSATALATLAFLAVFREGAEAVLYLGAVAANSSWHAVTVGAVIGFGIAILLGYLIYRGGMRFFTLQRFFAITSAFLLVFATGMVGRATLAYQAAGVLPGTIAAWDTSHLLPETSGLGLVLRTLVGYTAMPSVLQVALSLGYVALVAAVWADLGVRTDAAASARFPTIGASYSDRLYRVLRGPLPRKLLPASMLVIFGLLIAVAVLPLDVGPFNNGGPLHWGPFVNSETRNNLFNFTMWIVWLPLLSLSTILLGRFWCGNLCPLRLVTEWARRCAEWVGLPGARVTAPLRLGWLLPASFLLITFFVRGWNVQSVARDGALLFLVIFAFAFTVGFLSRRGAWCRYFCPVGGWLARAARLSPLGLRADRATCATCTEKPCLTGTASAGRCPSYLNPLRLETSRYCLKCWDCVVNCPLQKSSIKLGWQLPGGELLKPRAPEFWESVFVASLLGMYMAAGHRSPELAKVPWPALFFGLVALATLAYVAVCGVAGRLAGVSLRTALSTFGYIFLPFEFATALIAFGDDALEFFGIVQAGAAVLLTVGFVWSIVLGVSILRNHSRGGLRALAGAVPLGATLLVLLLVWFQWYAAGGVVDLT